MPRKFFVATGVLCALAFLMGTPRPPRSPEHRVVTPTQGGHLLHDVALESRIRGAFGSAPLQFEENVGQTDPSVKFMARGGNFMLFLTPAEAALSIHTPRTREKLPPQLLSEGAGWADAMSATSVVRIEFAGANSAARLAGIEPQSGTINYLRGKDPKNWQRNVPHFSRVRYEGIYPGVDAVFYGDRRQMEYDFVVAPNADTSAIRMRVEGAGSVVLNAEGGVEARTPAGMVSLLPPKVYQQVDGQTIEGRYVWRAPGEIGFEVERYDRGQALVIDPAVDVNRQGRREASGRGRGPIRRQSPPNSPPPTGGSVAVSTQFGGNSDDSIQAITVSEVSGHVYVAGFTDSTFNNFPVTTGPFGPGGSFFVNCQIPQSPCGDAFVAEFDVSNLQAPVLLASTYVGGSNDDVAWGLAVDPFEEVYLVGQTSSTDFPIAGAAPQTSVPPGNCGTVSQPRACHHVFVSALTSDLTNLDFSTYLGGTDDDEGFAIAADANQRVYITGAAGPNFPTTTPSSCACTPFQTNYAGGGDAFVAALDPFADAENLVYSTYVGGSGTDAGLGIEADTNGNAYVGGVTFSTLDGSFPITGSALQGTSIDAINCGPGNAFTCGDGFVLQMNFAGSVLSYSTFLGGANADQVNAVAIADGGSGNITVFATGQTASFDFQPVQLFDGTPFQDYNGGIDAFVASLPLNGGINYATYLGGSGDDIGLGIAIDASGDVFVSGSTTSGNGSGFPLVHPVQATTVTQFFAPTSFVTVLDPGGQNALFSTYYGGSTDYFGNTPIDVGNAIALDQSGRIFLAGRTTSLMDPNNFTNGGANGSQTLCLINAVPGAAPNQTFVDYNGFLVVINPTDSAAGCLAPLPSAGTLTQFDNTLVGATSPPQLVVTIINQGNHDLANAITFSSPDFHETDTCSAAVPGGDTAAGNGASNTCQITVNFQPTSGGQQNATMTIANNSASPICVANGACTYALSALGLVQATAALTPNPLAFAGTTAVGQQSAPLIATLTNTTTATPTPLNITAITLGGANPGDFVIQPGSTCSAPGQVGFDTSCQLNVVFAPTAAGARAATLTVMDDAVGGSQTINLTGTATAPPPQLSLPPVNLQFAPQGQGTTSAAQTIIITNSAAAGSQNLTVTQPLTFTGANPGDFAASGCAAAVAPQTTCTISVTFTPTATGARAATLQIASNAGSPQTVNVSGTGLSGPTATPSGAVTFAAQAVNTTSAPMSVTLTNSGATALPITSIALSGGDVGDFAILSNGCGTSLSANTACVVSVTFTPLSIAPFATSLVFTDSVGMQTVAISGTGVAGGAGALSLSAPLFFGAVIVGTTSPAQMVNITNTGGSAISFTSITASGDFATTNTCTTSLNPGSTCIANVTFTPTANGNRTGLLTVSYNAQGSPQVVSLSGVGATITIAPTQTTGSTVTVSPGDTAQYNLSVTGTQGLIVQLNLSCTSAAPFTLCTVSPATITLGGPTPPTVLVTVQTNCNPSFVGPRGPSGWPGSPDPLAPFAAFGGLAMLCALLLRRLPQPWAARLAPVLVLILLVTTFTACVHNDAPIIPGSPTTPAGAYNVMVVATGSNGSQVITKQLALTLRVI